MNIIIFGSNGQDGVFLSILAKSNGYNVICVSRSNADIIGDVSNFSFVSDLILKYTPYFVFHFAANSTVSHNALFENHKSICEGSINILEAVKLFSPSTKIFLSGSAMQFKNEGSPIDENSPFEASSVYSIARIQSVYAGRYFRENLGLKVYVGYFFNHDSYLRSERHVCQKIVRAVQRIKNGSKEKLEIGNIEVLKEFNYAGDIVEAIWILVNQNNIFEAVIGCGEVHSIKEWLKFCFDTINKNWEEHTQIKQDFISEYDILVSDPTLIKSLGWKPKFNFQDLAISMLNN